MSYTGVYVFGDSLVDAGNALKLAEFVDDIPLSSLPDGAPTAADGYYMGRFTNGLTFADLVSNKFISVPTKPTFPSGYEDPWLGISFPFTSDPNGNNLNFAYAGAQIRKGDEAVPDLDDQTDAYRDAVDGDADPNALHLVTIGGNDVRELVPGSGAIATPATALARLANAAEEWHEEISQLIGIGVRHIVVTGIPDVGIIPYYNGTADEAARRQAATDYSELLDSLFQSRLVQLHSAFPTVDIDYVSLVESTSSILANLEKVYNPAELYPLDESELLFFDSVHPTAQVHALLAASILDNMSGSPAAETIALTAPDYILNGSIAATQEVDRIVISLAANASYGFEMLGISSGSGTLADPLLRILGPGGNLIGANDDSGLGLDANFQFSTGQAGDYVIELTGVGSLAGSYRFQAAGNTTGNNSYIVSTSAALILENAGEGYDTVLASVSYALAAGVSVEKLATSSDLGTTSIDLTGNEFDQNLVGNAGSNILRGWGGNDTLSAGGGADALYGDTGNDILNGGSGADQMYGGAGNDTLNGGAGSDQMVGGTGNDIYYVDVSGDVVTELAGEGVDRVQSAISYSLPSNVENLTVTGTAASAIGNTLNNAITGNAAANMLSGLAGNDTLNGGAGSDKLYGGTGNDSLLGGTGSDSFYFDTALNGTTNVDKILDFLALDDTIILDRSVFSGISSEGILGAPAFYKGVTAHDIDDRIVYNQSLGTIFYDADGSGALAAIAFAQITANTALTNTDFFLIA